MGEGRYIPTLTRADFQLHPTQVAIGCIKHAIECQLVSITGIEVYNQ